MNGSPAASTARSRLVWAGAATAALAAAAVLAFWTPSGDPQATVCYTRRWLGLPCAGCGMTRAFAALAQGRWSDAVRLHPLAPALVLQGLAAWLTWGLVLARRIRPPGRRGILLWVALNAAALIGVWLVRLFGGSLPR